MNLAPVGPIKAQPCLRACDVKSLVKVHPVDVWGIAHGSAMLKFIQTLSSDAVRTAFTLALATFTLLLEVWRWC